MSSKKRQVNRTQKATQANRATQARQVPVVQAAEVDQQALQRAIADPLRATAGDIAALQSAYGNRAVSNLLRSAAIQAKLIVGAAGDRYEQEADSVAERVISVPAPGTPLPTSTGAGQGAPSAQRQKGEEATAEPAGRDRRRENGSSEAGQGLEALLSAQKGGGSLLPAGVRSFMEPRFGADFGSVRVHTDSKAAQLSRSLSAKAFAYGQDIYFGTGGYDPGTTAGKRLLAHELTHVVQQGGTKVIRRWAEEEHKAFGNLAAQMAMKHSGLWKVPGTDIVPSGVGKRSAGVHGGSDKERAQYREHQTKVGALEGTLKGALGGKRFGTSGVGVAYKPHWYSSKRKYMSFGEATMLGGDYFKTAKGLAKTSSLNPFEMQKGMTLVALTNTNHFFPLAGLEWKTQYTKALNLALQANRMYRAGKKEKGDSKAETAMQYLGVAVHFLQDTFASGHQYPRALDDIGTRTGLGLATGGAPSKTYHDALCVLKNGLPMKYGNGKRFHGDTTAGASDAPVVEESYRALAHILATISGSPVPSDALATPKHNPGPDVGAIEQDPEAGPIWVSMISHLEKGKLVTAKRATGRFSALYQTHFTTSAGTSYTAEEFMAEWKKLGSMKKKPTTTVEKLVDAALKGQSNVLHAMTRGTSLTAPGKSLDTKADDKIRAIIKAEGVPLLTHNQTVMVIGALITGVCTGADERAVLRILDRQSDSIVLSVVQELTPKKIDSGLDGESWDEFLTVWASKGLAGNNPGADYIIKEKNQRSARRLVGRLSVASQMDRLSHKQWNDIVGVLGGWSFFHSKENRAAIDKIALYFGLPSQATR